MRKCKFTYVAPLVDKKDRDKTKKYCWYLDQRGYVTAWIPEAKEHQTLHIVLLGKPPIGYVWDHINQNKQDNRRENLRLTTKSVNAINGKISSNSSTGIRGVSKRRGGFRAYITRHGKQFHLGDFKTMPEAVQTRKEIEESIIGKNWAEMKPIKTV